MRRIYTLLAGCLASIFTPIIAQSAYNLADTTIANRLMKEYPMLASQEKYDSAFAKVDTAQMIYEQVLGKETLKVSTVLEAKCRLLIVKRKFEEAESLAEKVLAIRLKLYGENHPSVARAYSLFGRLYAGQLLSAKALIAYEKQIDIIKKIQPLDEVMLADVYSALANVYAATDELVKTCQYFEQAQILYAKTLGEDNHKSMHTLMHLSKYYGDNAETDKAYMWAEKARNIIEKMEEPRKMEELSNLYVQYVNIYGNRGDTEKALHYTRLYENTQRTIEGTSEKAFTYRLLADIYNEKGDCEKGLAYAYKSLDLAMKGTQLFSKIQSYDVLLRIYSDHKDYDNALKYCRMAFDSSKLLVGFSDSRVNDFAHTLARLYQNKEKYDESQQMCYDLLREYNKNHQRATFKHVEVYEILGDAYFGKRMYDSAMYSYKKSLDVYYEMSGKRTTQLGNTEQKMMATLEAQKNFEKAETCLTDVLTAQNYVKNQSLDKVTSLPIVIDNLDVIAGLERRWYLQTGDEKRLQKSLDTYNEAFAVLSYHNSFFNAAEAQVFQKQKLYALYEGRIQTLLLFKTKSKQAEAFTVSEMGKASALQTQLKETDALHFAQLPDSLLLREKEVRLTITTLEKGRQERLNQGKSETDKEHLSLAIRIDSLHVLYADMKRKFEKDYPDYYRLKYDYTSIPLSKLQQKLTKDQTLLSYCVGDSGVYAFVVRQDTFAVFDFKKDFPLESWVKQLRNGLYGYHTARVRTEQLYENCADSFAIAAFALHNRLITPLSNLLTKELIIVPDGVLNYVPFDALLLEQPKDALKFEQHRYFGNQHSISYNYSATLWQEMLTKKHKVEPTKNFIGFAPYYNGDSTLLSQLFSHDLTMRKGLDSLKYSGEEVFKAQKLMQGDAILNKNATKTAFETTVGNYRIVHLATHGKANDKVGDYSFLAFTEQKDSIQNELLYVRDIYNLNLNADLVVLSACETGIGELKRGEGVISLARAFTYAGAKSLVTTLWSVNDKSTMQIMEGFYRQLRKGASKDKALWQSKLDYLAKAKSEMAHPFFWSAFVPIGDMSPIKH